MMSKISSITCHKIVNSRGDWTIDTKVTLDDGSFGTQTIPDGASKGEHEAHYIPVNKSVEVVSTVINDVLKGGDPFNQKELDQTLIEMDGTEDKRHLGANSILSVSLATAKACAVSKKQEFYQYLAHLYGRKLPKSSGRGREDLNFPTPLFNVLNGGKHADNNLSFQEFMVIPSPSYAYDKALEVGIDCYHLLKEKLEKSKIETDVGDEGGFAPQGFTAETALHYLKSAVSKKYEPGKDVFFGIDAASGSFRSGHRYNIKEERKILTSGELSIFYLELIKNYEIVYLEDPFYEGDHSAWEHFYKLVGDRVLISADDLVVTNPNLLKEAIDKKLANAVIVKPNQIGTLSETFEFIRLAKKAKLAVTISHRSGDTSEDTSIADLALAVDADFIKSGAPARGERVAKYNRLLDIFYSVNK